MSAFPILDHDQLTAALHRSGLVLLDFWQGSCAPCRALEPRLEQLAQRRPGQFTGHRIDVDTNHATPAEFGVRSIPTLVLLRITDPSPTRRGLLTVWLLAALVFGVLLLIARLARGPLDDPDQAYQRPGILDLTALPRPAPPVTGDLPGAGHPAVVFFERPNRLPALCATLPATRLGDNADLVIVTPTVSDTCGSIMVIPDPDGSLAGAYGIRRPAVGDPPVGYAIVDAHQQIRYRTLDPTVASELSEVRTMLEAL